MNLRNVLRAYSLLRQLSDDESALLETLRQTNENERALLVEAMSDRPPQKKSSKKGAGSKAGGKSARASGMAEQLKNRRREAHTLTVDNESERCIYESDNDGPCGATADANVHHLRTHPDYHPFKPAVQPAANLSSANGGDESSTVNLEVEKENASTATGG